ncbi:ubiquinone biosynthesis O-methyltransferase-like [Anopheles ziemanni]|uniref:ubiquinone biosynthesis O-methyltransferase-like n=1 Tax=Anopheles coustani TaxID=139045 RepID=UPI00265AA99D|nr:ubiquinone biosynthesis O-methyltransferase-like [Anopheles coustani]XP_058171572.1 ubiquinone biosynthesis O-methyltransferase-like [Anopheles ziemanni]
MIPQHCLRLFRQTAFLRRTSRSFSSPSDTIRTQYSNVDQREVENLSKQSTEWWDPNGPIRGLHAMNALRVPLIRDGLIATGVVERDRIQKPDVLRNVNILEVGCGGGILTEVLARLQANVVGIDPSEKLIGVARDHAKENRSLKQDLIQYHVETVEQHAAKNYERYDAVVSSEVLEHVNDKVAFIEQCLSNLKPGGSFFITTISKTTPSWLGAIVAAEQIFKLVPEGTHDWDKFISPLDLQRILTSYNCNTILVHGMFYQFWSNRWCWTQNTDINYAIQAVKIKEA